MTTGLQRSISVRDLYSPYPISTPMARFDIDGHGKEGEHNYPGSTDEENARVQIGHKNITT